MGMELRWLMSTSTSSLHAAAAIVHGGSIANSDLAVTLDPAAKLFSQEIQASGHSIDELLAQLIPLSASIENNRQLTETALRKAFGPRAVNPESVSRIAGAVSEMENSFVGAVPDAMTALETRGRVLREQWESRGPGMLASISRLTEKELIAEQADVVLVHPILGGAGSSFIMSNLVMIEAVLANPDSTLPETVRLGWLLSTLNLELPMHSETLPRNRLSVVGRLAMLPVALAAAEEVEWCHDNPDLLPAAIELWQLRVSEPAAVAAVVGQWWESYRTAKPRWLVALAALHQALEEQDLLA